MGAPSDGSPVSALSKGPMLVGTDHPTGSRSMQEAVGLACGGGMRYPGR